MKVWPAFSLQITPPCCVVTRSEFLWRRTFFAAILVGRLRDFFPHSSEFQRALDCVISHPGPLSVLLLVHATWGHGELRISVLIPPVFSISPGRSLVEKEWKWFRPLPPSNPDPIRNDINVDQTFVGVEVVQLRHCVSS